MVLNGNDGPLSHVPGIGKRRAQIFERIGVKTISDLLLLPPHRYEDRSTLRTLVEAVQHGEGLVAVRVIAHEYFPRGRQRVLKIKVIDDSGSGVLVCFGRNFLAKTFPVGTDLIVFGTFTLRYGEIQSSTFDAEKGTGETVRFSGLLPVYPLTEGLTQRIVRDAVHHVLATAAPTIADPLPPRVREEEHLIDLGSAIRALHRPNSLDEVEIALRTFRYHELFFFQINLAVEALRRRQEIRKTRSTPHRHLAEQVEERIPFELTTDQREALARIIVAMDNPWPMNSLLHGDVGSGKTLVALLAAIHAIERGEQVVLMVPTELLARQHAWNAANLLGPVGIHVALALGSTAEASKRGLGEAVAEGSVDLIVGTHALFSERYNYCNLGLVIIDEQHRFGVAQRNKIIQRGTAPDLLLMSATPIPRSLALTAFGDSEVIAITKMPPGRKPVRTHLARMGNEERVYNFVAGELEAGHQAYFVYPAIDEGSRRELRSATEMYEQLQRRFSPYTVALVHSQIDPDTRASIMEQFRAGDVRVLVATSVIEVGVDVPNATCIVIEHAEVFGLAALHQLRGRIGRGADQGYCILVYQEPITDDGRERLKVLYESTDGFFIAEEDLRIRGPGDLLGTRQSGFLQFRFADIRRDMDMMIRGRKTISSILEQDPHLEHVEHRPIKETLSQMRSNDRSTTTDGRSTINEAPDTTIGEDR